VLAWTLALLVAPALASADCSANVAFKTYIGLSGGDWDNPANWQGGTVPFTTDHVCIPAGKSVVLSSMQTIADIDVDAGGGLTLNFGDLTTSGGTGSTLAGAIQANGPLTLGSNTLLSGAMTLGDTVNVGSGVQLTIPDGADIPVNGSGTIANAGSILVTGSTAANDTQIDAVIKGDGSFQTDGPVKLTGGGSGSGPWKLGSGSTTGSTPEPVLTLAGGAGTFYSFEGVISDVGLGGRGHVILDDSHLDQAVATSGIDIAKMDLTGPNAQVDDSSPSAVRIDDLTMADGVAFEVDAPLTVKNLIERKGELVCNGDWTIGSFHWGGGKIGTGSSGVGSITVQTLDMSVEAGTNDTGARLQYGPPLTVTGTATYADGTLELGNGNLTIDNGAAFYFDGDRDITLLGGGRAKVVNNGWLEKRIDDAGLGSNIAPAVVNSKGTIVVTPSKSALNLAVAPDEYVGTTLEAGTYTLNGTLSFPGVITALGADVRYMSVDAQLLDSTPGQEMRQTLVSNNAGSALTITDGVTFAAADNFTNDGVLTVNGTGSVSVPPGKTLTQNGTLGGTGTVTADVTNSGIVTPGNSPGTLTIDGNYTQASGGLLHEELGGPAAGQFDKLAVTGTATLAGTLSISSFGGYSAPVGQAFDFLTAARGITGTFTTVNQPAGAPMYEPSYSATTARLTANGISVGDATVPEGNAGTTATTFTISLGQAEPGAVSVDWTTQDGTAAAGSDYAAASGTVTFAPGETSKTVAVAVTGDTTPEADENFAVNLSNAAGSRIVRANGVGTITNDDAPPLATPVATVSQLPTVPPDDIDGFAIAPPPVQGKKVNVEPVRGKVLVRLPGKIKFVALPDAEQVPVGTIVDATKGTVRLYSVGKGGRIQSILFYEGVFQVAQKVGQALTRAKLFGASFKACPSARASASATRKKKLKPTSSVGHLWGEGSGEFQTVGRYASATVRGTKWLTDDHCNGTLIRVRVGAVTVRDLTLKKSLVLKKPKSYLALALKPKKK
jgi:hypothetical protein